MRTLLIPCLLLSTAILPGGAVLAQEAAAADAISFRRDIAPILVDNCSACHGPKKAEGGYRVDTYERVITAGDSGLAAFTAMKADDSEVLRRIVSEDADERMPLDGDPLPADQIQKIRLWIEQGATYDGGDPKVTLASIIPPAVYAQGPEKYAFTIPVTALAFSRDGQELFAAGYHEVTVWNPQDGTLKRRITNVGQRTMALAVSPDGNLLAVGGGTPGKLGEVRIFDVVSGELRSVLATTTDVVLDVAFHPAGDRLAIAGADNMLRVIELATSKDLLSITSHSDWVTSVAWNADGSRLASGSRDKTAKVFDGVSGELLVTYSGHSQPVKGVAFHAEGKDVFSSGADNKIHRWAIADGKKGSEVALGGEVYRLVLVGDMLLGTSADKTMRQLDAKEFKQTRSLSGHKDWVLSAAGHAESKRLASAAFDGEVRVWNAESGELVVAFVAAPGYDPAAAP